MAANHREYRIFPGSIEYYIGKVRSVGSAGLKFNVTGEQPIQNGLLFFLNHGVSFSSWGENIKLALVSQGDQTVVDIDSECALGTQIVDWGKNKDNVNKLFNYLSQGSPPLRQPGAQPQQNAAGSAVCPKCGAPVNGAGSFCTVCGAKLR